MDKKSKQIVARELVKVAKDLVALKAEHGFDLTDIKANKWSRLLKMIGAKDEAKRLNNYTWIWKGRGVTIYTGNNPITGEYAASQGRGNEVDYASYIGIDGNPEIVTKVADFIRKNASYIKDESPGEREYI